MSGKKEMTLEEAQFIAASADVLYKVARGEVSQTFASDRIWEHIQKNHVPRSEVEKIKQEVLLDENTMEEKYGTLFPETKAAIEMTNAALEKFAEKLLTQTKHG